MLWYNDNVIHTSQYMLQGPAFNAVTVENVIIANSWPLRLKYLLSSEVNPIICKGEKVLKVLGSC